MHGYYIMSCDYYILCFHSLLITKEEQLFPLVLHKYIHIEVTLCIHMKTLSLKLGVHDQFIIKKALCNRWDVGCQHL